MNAITNDQDSLLPGCVIILEDPSYRELEVVATKLNLSYPRPISKSMLHQLVHGAVIRHNDKVLRTSLSVHRSEYTSLDPSTAQILTHQREVETVP